VAQSVLRGFPLGLIYFTQRDDGMYEVLDGQQRITSLGRFRTNKLPIMFDGREQNYNSLNDELKAMFDNTPLTIYICQGTEKEIKEWFQIINIGGVRLNDQEMRNAIYSGPFVTKMKAQYSNSQKARSEHISNCPLCAMGSGANKTKIYKLSEMDADHVTAWSKGGSTTIDNCQLLCKTHNRSKGNA